MALSIRIPDALDFTAYRLAVGDTTALITKITSTQADLENFSTGLNNYTTDLHTLAEEVEAARVETVQTAHSVNLPNASEQPGSWLRAQADGSYDLEIVSHSDIEGLPANYLARTGGSITGSVTISDSLTVGGVTALTLSGGTLSGELKANAGLSVLGYPVLTRDPLTDGFYSKWDASKGRIVSSQIQWSEVQQKPALVEHATLSNGEYLKWDSAQNKATSTQIEWSEVQQKPDLVEHATLSNGEYLKWDSAQNKATSTQVQWTEVQQKPDLVEHATLSNGEYLKWDSAQNKATSTQIQWAEVQQKPSFIESGILTNGQPIRWDEAQGKAVTNPIQWAEVEQKPQFSTDALSGDDITFSYDIDGNIEQISQQINGKARTITAAYFQGDLQSITDVYDGISRTEVINYNASGQISGIAVNEVTV